ncbi:hypothetical protein O9Z70_11040 [Devosia sp. YIM 151766]|uniref:hypothetical protein n=1 Tax=Devosia sp. YIM 151766 TaxID=3017325 RepID=UPI00255C3ACB|nr:hypothetical protein [Devosia sp. YIM 151766]WIY52014.1 hypothetical protein O9Z70_11040 [Devosia sp. YIM 151766]
MHYRQIEIGEDAPDAVTVGIERGENGSPIASIWWPARPDADADEAMCNSVEEALEKAEAARELYGFSEIVIALQSSDLWQPAWGELGPAPLRLNEAEALELARATEASRDA